MYLYDEYGSFVAKALNPFQLLQNLLSICFDVKIMPYCLNTPRASVSINKQFLLHKFCQNKEHNNIASYSY